MENIGMMDEGYFVSRSEILNWINDLLQLKLTKIEQLGSGAVYCQLLDTIYPGKVPMNKVNWKSKLEWEFLNNLKILQHQFTKLGIPRKIEIEKLSRAKYQDNLEFIQWFKRYIEMKGGCSDDYDPISRRNSNKVDFSFAEKVVIPKIYNSNGVVVSNTPISNDFQRNKSPQVKPAKFVEKKNPSFNFIKNKSPTNIDKNCCNSLEILNEIKMVLLSKSSSDDKICVIGNFLNISKEKLFDKENFNNEKIELEEETL